MILFILLKYVIYIGPALKDLRIVIYRSCAKRPARRTRTKNAAYLRFSTCARPAIFLLEVTLVVKVVMANSISNINVG